MGSPFPEFFCNSGTCGIGVNGMQGTVANPLLPLPDTSLKSLSFFWSGCALFVHACFRAAALPGTPFAMRLAGVIHPISNGTPWAHCSMCVLPVSGRSALFLPISTDFFWSPCHAGVTCFLQRH